jgi:hypothetical protein
MFNSEFYPTPKEVIQKMLDPYYVPEPGDNCEDPKAYRKYRHARENNKLNDLSILEPSAGKGDILKFIQEEFTYNKRSKDFYCIEPEPELQHILREEGYRVIGNDFLNYSGDYYFDLIIMNPPFSNGDQHLLKAWEILKEGEIICLLNSETLLNPYTERRQLITKIIEDHGGEVEHLGQVFKNAERPTDVDISIIRLRKVLEGDKLQFDFKNITKETEHKLNEDILKNPIATRDIVGNMILQYDKTKEYFIRYLETIEGLKFYGKGLVTEYFDFEKVVIKDYSDNKKQSYNKFNDTLKSEIWKVVINHLNIEKYMTHAVRQRWSQFCQHQGALDFTKENVFDLVNMVFENRYSILDQAIVDVFNIFTSYHKENRCYVEGWKTNDKWKVNKKIILPNGVSFDEKWAKQYGAEFKIDYSTSSEYSDIDKVMCYISGTSYENCYSINSSLENRFRRLGKIYTGDKIDNTGESQFFKWKFWRKGTLHLEFKDERLWQEFNMRACAGKKWLPESEKKKWEESKEKPVINPLQLTAV